ncbi:MAG: hypothetical protein ACI3VN_01750 [Candidatus Onthomonas sp.]
MKKSYVKPELVYESFVLNQHIADCGWELQLASETSCYATGDAEWGNPADVKAFTDGVNGCEIEPEGYCYTNGSSAVGLFRS